MIEKGTLPIGVEWDGIVRKKFSLRPLKMRDSLALAEIPEELTRDEQKFGMTVLAKRLAIEGVPTEAMTLEFMLELYDMDMSEILAADKRLANALESFRGQAQAATAVGAGAAEDGVCRGAGAGDDPDGGPAVA